MSNTPIKLQPFDKLPEHMQAAWQRSNDLRGETTFIEALGNTPELFDWYREFYERVFYGGRVAVNYKELARLRLSMVHGCRYCNLGNRHDARAAGIDEAKIDNIATPDARVFDDAERAVIKLADQMCLRTHNGELSPAMHKELAAHFNEADIVELGMTMAVLVGMARFLFVFDLVERDPVCALPEARAT